MLSDSVLVAYNAPFDVSFLRTASSGSAARPSHPTRWWTSWPSPVSSSPGGPRYPQSAVAALLGISYPVRHRAIEDAMVTSKILMHFLSMLKAYGRGDIRDLMRKDIGRSIGTQRAEKSQRFRFGGDLWIRYLSPSDGEVTQRIVTPNPARREGRIRGPIRNSRRSATYCRRGELPARLHP